MIYQMAVPQFSKMLKNLKNLLKKGEALAVAKKFEPTVLLNDRLVADQFNLIKQVQIATDTAKLCAVRLTGKEAPTHKDQETTIPELMTRIDEVCTYLGKLTPADFENYESKKITNQWWNGKTMTGEDYFIHHAVPNFYFHVTTAYAILRHNGVEIGKSDFLGELPFKN